MKQKKTNILFSFFCILLCFFFGCKNHISNNNNTCNCKEIKNKYAKYFKIFICKDSIIAEVNKIKENSTEKNIARYILSAHNIKYPVRSVGITSTSYIGYIEKLNELPKIKMVDNISFYKNIKILELYKKGEIKEIGPPNMFNIELLLTQKPDIIFTYSLSEKDISYYNFLKDKNIKIVIVSEFLEEHPLGRAEWIKFFSVFFNKLDTANKIFNEIEKKYNLIKENIDINRKYSPKIFTEAPFNGIWYIPGGKSITAKLIDDAGGNYVFKNYTDRDVYMLNFEQVYSLCNSADIWINAGNNFTINQLLSIEPRIKQFKAFKHKKIYSPLKKIGTNGKSNEYFEQGAINPHLLLLDFYNIFNNNDSNLFYYIKLK
ncbi:MAG: ABC transporter substrate-binding protein [Bacteroidales bacterium]|nr:ABC transporter substrate-binding protein [Bacteroidales bacterium]